MEDTVDRERIEELIRKVLPFLWIFIITINIVFMILSYNTWKNILVTVPYIVLIAYSIYELAKAIINKKS